MKTKTLSLIRRLTSFTAIAVVSCFLASCGEKETDKSAEKGKDSPAEKAAASSAYPGTEAGAQALVSDLAKPGADVVKLSSALRPAKADFEAIFAKDLADKLFDSQDPMWNSGSVALKPKEGQTETKLFGVSSADFKAWAPAAAKSLPGGYQKIKDQIKEGLTFYVFKFVEPGKPLGMSYDTLVYVNGHWVFVNKPWKAAE